MAGGISRASDQRVRGARSCRESRSASLISSSRAAQASGGNNPGERNDSLPMTCRAASLGFFLSLLIAPLALAQQPVPPSPSQEAVAACAGRESGASCPVQHQGQTAEPSPEAIEACDGQQDGAACGIAGPRGEPLAGVCRSGAPDEPAACVPNSLPEHPGTGCTSPCVLGEEGRPDRT